MNQQAPKISQIMSDYQRIKELEEQLAAKDAEIRRLESQGCCRAQSTVVFKGRMISAKRPELVADEYNPEESAAVLRKRVNELETTTTPLLAIIKHLRTVLRETVGELRQNWNRQVELNRSIVMRIERLEAFVELQTIDQSK